jgi:two-component system, chemotaxis family, protein-glutamate methylesterase/glutaminase
MEPDKSTAIKVMIVDDSSLIRSILSKALETSSEIKVAKQAANGLLAIDLLKQNDIDVLILDVEMPEMDGITALPKLLQISPLLKIIMVSTLTQKNAPITIECLTLGAADYIAKPSTMGDGSNGNIFTQELVNKVLALGHAAQQARQQRIPAKAIISAPVGITLRPNTMKKTLAIAIACSTGGPQALDAFFNGIVKYDILKKMPIFITQHMPPVFTKCLAEHLSKSSGIKAKEAQHQELVAPGIAYIAPGDYHMVIKTSPLGNMIHLNKDPLENYCRPAADPMLKSLAAIYQDNLMVLVLSGMGRDGANGVKEVVNAGGAAIVQDEKSSVVWGMPGAVAKEGNASAILPLPQIADHVFNLLK